MLKFKFYWYIIFRCTYFIIFIKVKTYCIYPASPLQKFSC